jgi:hypothetical protein
LSDRRVEPPNRPFQNLGEFSLTEAEREFMSLLREGLAQETPRMPVAAA